MLDMGKTAENRICSSLCFSRTLGLCIAALVFPSLVFTFLVSFGSSPFLLTIPILVLSTIFIVTFKKKRVILDDNPMQDEEDLICDQKILYKKEVDTLRPSLETASQTMAAQQLENGLMQEYQDESPPDIQFSSDSESSNDSIIGVNFDLNLMSSNYMEKDEAISDVSVSDADDDSLIEISLPGSKSGGLDEEPKQKPQYSNIHGLLPDSIFQQQDLMELLTEITEMNNEEENLIEIDLSKGPNQMFKVRD